ncbi:MAG: transposase [Candidatus Peregrinibacteria bacterium]
MTQRHFVQNDHRMLVTTNTRDRRPVFADPVHAREAVEHLYRVQQEMPFCLFGFVIMPDHCHFLVYVPAPATVSECMRTYKMGLTFQIGIGAFWQPRFHIRLVEDSSAALRYIHFNPVKAGLCENPEDYPWSSASGRWDVTELGMVG